MSTSTDVWERRCGLCGHPRWLHRNTGCTGTHPGVNQMRFQPCECQKYEAAT